MTRNQRRSQRIRRREELEFQGLEELARAGALNRARVAHHEMGHSTILWFQRHARVFVSVTTIAVGDNLGLTQCTWPAQKTRAQMRALLCVQMAGKVAEERAFEASLCHGDDAHGDQQNWKRTARAQLIAQRRRAREELEFRRQEALARDWDDNYNKARVAHHEMGHSALLWFQRHAGVFLSTSVVRNPNDVDNLGRTRSSILLQMTRAQMKALLAVQLGGQVAEHRAFDCRVGHGDGTAGDDQHNWARTARAVRFGFNDPFLLSKIRQQQQCSSIMTKTAILCIFEIEELHGQQIVRKSVAVPTQTNHLTINVGTARTVCRNVLQTNCAKK